MIQTDVLSPVTIKRTAGVLHSEGTPAVEFPDGLKWWFFKGKLHRANGPAVESPSGTAHYFWRGVKVFPAIVDGSLQDPKEIMAISNIEQRRCAMERVGYLVFRKYMKEIDRHEDMYVLYSMEIKGDEDLRLLTMRDPSLGCMYAIRVAPTEKKCKIAVAHSYGFKTWEEYHDGVSWV